MDHQFRNAAFGGFNRQDVLDYLETAAKERAQQIQTVQQQLQEVTEDRDRLSAQHQALAAQASELTAQRDALQGRAGELEGQLDDQRTQLETARAEGERLRSELEQLRQELAQTRQTLDETRPQAEAYAAIKERTAGVELEAHRRAQDVQTAAQLGAQKLRRQMESWMARVEREYAEVRSSMDATVSHAAGELQRVGDMLGALTALMERQDQALEDLSKQYDDTDPEKVPAPMPIAAD